MKETFHELVEKELKSCEYGPIHSGHEGYALLKERLDKYWSTIHGCLRCSKCFAMVEMAVIAQRIADHLDLPRKGEFQDLVLEEYERDGSRLIHSPHEGYALLKELLDDYWDLVRKREVSSGLDVLVKIAVVAQCIAEDFANVAIAATE